MPRSRAFPIEVLVTPRFDVFYALHTVASESQTPLGAWRDNAKARLPRDFAGSARRVAPVPIFWPLLADAVQGTDGAMGFQDILSTLGSMAADELKANVVAGIFHDRATAQALLAGKRTLRQVLMDDDYAGAELLSHFGLRPYTARSPATVAMEMLLSDTKSYRDQMVLVLKKFWDSGFSADWRALEPAMRSHAAALDARAGQATIADLAAELRLPIVMDESMGVMRTKSGAGVKFDRIARCYLIPSAFNTRRWWAKYEDANKRVTLYFPVWGGADAANALADDKIVGERPRAAKVNAEAVFRALGDTTRYAIASILARSPTTSADLSRALNVSKPTITHHVQALRSAGLITERTEGGSSLLSLDRDTLAALSAAAVKELFSSTGELQLLTTRKRRGGPRHS
jgi:DNA-binding transcriptional ArsR family regulator